jgi:hypothetical protein
MKLDAKAIVAGSLEVAAALAATQDAMRDAAHLAGAASRLLDELGSPRQGSEQGIFDDFVETIRASLGAGADAEIQRGWELSPDEAAAIALAATADLG